jgi:TPR repeat protein
MQKAAIIFAGIVLGLVGAGPTHAAEVRTVAVGATDLFHAAEQGDPRAQTQVGFMYETGRGLPQDYMSATYWYRRAAEQGYSRAQYLLGLMYDKGQGVGSNYIVAHKWLNLAASAADRGDREHFLRLRNALARKMTVAEVTEAQRLARDWRPLPER